MIGCLLRRCAQMVALASLMLAAPVLALAADPALERIERAVAEHPDDPDLLWAHARALAKRGRSEEAIRVLRIFAERFPDRRPDLDLELGRVLYEGDSPEEALAALDRALARDGGAATAHFYRGLALRDMGRRDEAHAALAQASELSPVLAPDAMLLRGVDLLEAGQEGAADDLFGRVIELAPGGAAATRARLLLLDRLPTARKRWLRLDAFAGVEWDSNVTLEEGRAAFGPTADDPLGNWGAGITLRPWQGRRSSFELGWVYDQTAHAEFDDFDVMGNSLWLSGQLRPWQEWRLRLDLLGSDVRRAGSAYARSATIRPAIARSFGPRVGFTSLSAELTWRDYLDELEGEDADLITRDGLEWGLGLRHWLPFGRPDAWVMAGFELRRNDTRAGSDAVLGGGSYDGWRFEGELRSALPLPFALSADTRLRVGHQRFDHDNFFILVEELELERRRDLYGDLRVALRREIAPHTRIELAWSGSLYRSNSASFTYDRQVVGLYFRVASE